MERYQRKFEESFNPGDKVKMIKGRYKNFITSPVKPRPLGRGYKGQKM